MQQTTIPAPAANSGASDADIMGAVQALATAAGSRNGYIDPITVYTPEMRDAGALLATLLGVPAAEAARLPDGELTAYYSVTRKSPAAARRMALKRFPTAPIPASPAVPMPTADMATIQAALAAEMATQLAMIEARLQAQQPRKVTFELPELPPVTVDHAHKALPRILRKVMKRRNVYVYGGVGTGKTTAAEQIAKILGLPFYMASTVFEEHKLFGYMFGGEYISTDFRRCYEFGGVFLFDEYDRSDPGIPVAFNAAFANGYCAFPDKLVYRHPDCIIIAAGNTAMRGATREFNAAQKADASVLERYCVIEMQLDLELEAKVCINADWLKYCRALRAEALKQSVEALIVSPRASIEGAIAIAEGDTWQEAADGYIWKGLDAPTRERLERAVPIAQYIPSEGGIL